MRYEFRVVYSSKAVQDLKDIYSYIAYELHALMAASRQIKRIKDQIHSLNRMPHRFAKFMYEPWKSFDVHKLPVDNFLVVYMVDDTHGAVMILRVVYAGMDLKGFITENN